MVLPAYNAAKTLKKNIRRDTFADLVDEVILCDDASQDDTENRHHIGFNMLQCMKKTTKAMEAIKNLLAIRLSELGGDMVCLS
ncbi:MAG: hypothetical protein IPJ13_23295 [Saprospiraceae bacterium]|nr:hypothetical protein [Saprospiraceae bacterium]